MSAVTAGQPVISLQYVGRLYEECRADATENLIQTTIQIADAAGSYN